MTDDQKIQALWECIQRDADKVAAEAFTLLRQRAEKAERERDAEREAVGLSAEDRDSAIQRAERAEADNAAMLEERKRIQKTLDQMDVPSEADEAEMGRPCDVAGRVELLATWGRRGWTEYRRLKDAESALLERMRALEEAWALTRTLFEDLAENGYGADAPFTSQEDAARVLALINAMKEKP